MPVNIVILGFNEKNDMQHVNTLYNSFLSHPKQINKKVIETVVSIQLSPVLLQEHASWNEAHPNPGFRPQLHGLPAPKPGTLFCHEVLASYCSKQCHLQMTSQFQHGT